MPKCKRANAVVGEIKNGEKVFQVWSIVLLRRKGEEGCFDELHHLLFSCRCHRVMPRAVAHKWPKFERQRISCKMRGASSQDEHTGHACTLACSRSCVDGRADNHDYRLVPDRSILEREAEALSWGEAALLHDAEPNPFEFPFSWIFETQRLSFLRP